MVRISSAQQPRAGWLAVTFQRMESGWRGKRGGRGDVLAHVVVERETQEEGFADRIAW